MHDYANFQFPRKLAAESATREQAEYVNYSPGRAAPANSTSTSTTNSSCSLPNLTSPPCHTHPKDRQGYEQLRQTFGDRFVFVEPEVVPKTRQEERDEVYVPFTPGHAPWNSSLETSRGSPPPKKAADYMPFVPLSGRKSDPCILDHDREPASGSGSLLLLQRSSESDPELAQLRSKSKYSKDRKPFDYLPFVPLAQVVKSAPEATQGKSEEGRESKAETEKDGDKDRESKTETEKDGGKDRKSVGEEDEVFPPSEHSSYHSEKMADQEEHTASPDPPTGGGGEDNTPQVAAPRLSNATSSCSTGEEDSRAVSNNGGRDSAEGSERHHPMAGSDTPSITDVNPPATETKKQGDSAYFVHRIEAGDSSVSSGENSPSPRVQSVAMSGSMCWNGNGNNNNTQGNDGPPPDETMDRGVRHSGEPSSCVHLLKEKETQESSSEVAKQRSRVATMVEKFQGNPPRQRARTGQSHKPADAGRKHHSSTRTASDRLSTSSYKSTASSSSQSSPPPSLRPRTRKQSRLESMGIVEDTIGGSFAV